MDNAKKVLSLLLGIVLGVMLTAFLIIVGRFLYMHPAYLYALVILGVVFVLLGLLWVYYWLWEKVSKKRYRAQMHALEVKRRRAEIAEIEEKRNTEIITRDRQLSLQERKLDLQYNQAEWNMKFQLRQLALEAEKSRYINFKQTEVLAVRQPDGGVDIAYVPAARVERLIASSQEQITIPDMPALPAPVGRRTINTMEVVNSGALEVPGEILLGFNERSEAVRKIWKTVKAVLILGLQGGGKTNTAI